MKKSKHSITSCSFGSFFNKILTLSVVCPELGYIHKLINVVHNTELNGLLYAFVCVHFPDACLCVLMWSAGQTSLSFSGNSYIKYRVTASSKDQHMKVSLKIRTLRNSGIIMYRHSKPCHMLKVNTNMLTNVDHFY